MLLKKIRISSHISYYIIVVIEKDKHVLLGLLQFESHKYLYL